MKRTAKRTEPASPAPPARRRADQWLWFTRLFKTRSLAAAFLRAGHARLNGRRVNDPATPLKPGDVLTLAMERAVRVIVVRDTGVRRGPAPEAQALYEDWVPGRDEAPLAHGDRSG